MLKRSTPLRRTGFARLEVGFAKCAICRRKFPKTRAVQAACPEHEAEYIEREVAKKAEARAKAQRKADKAKREKLKTRSQWVEEAEAAVRKFRRLEELSKGRGCMSCGRSQEEVQGTDGWKPGGAWDAGHFLSKGARPEIRMEPLNIWLQCKSCNAGSAKYARKGYTVSQNFETNLRAQEGDELVDRLKGPHPAAHYSIEDLKATRDKYRALARQLEKKE